MGNLAAWLGQIPVGPPLWEGAAGEHWVTMHGTHVLIDGAGTIIKGPVALRAAVGQRIEQLGKAARLWKSEVADLHHAHAQAHGEHHAALSGADLASREKKYAGAVAKGSYRAAAVHAGHLTAHHYASGNQLAGERMAALTRQHIHQAVDSGLAHYKQGVGVAAPHMGGSPPPPAAKPPTKAQIQQANIKASMLQAHKNYILGATGEYGKAAAMGLHADAADMARDLAKAHEALGHTEKAAEYRAKHAAHMQAVNATKHAALHQALAEDLPYYTTKRGSAAHPEHSALEAGHVAALRAAIDAGQIKDASDARRRMSALAAVNKLEDMGALTAPAAVQMRNQALAASFNSNNFQERTDDLEMAQRERQRLAKLADHPALTPDLIKRLQGVIDNGGHSIHARVDYLTLINSYAQSGTINATDADSLRAYVTSGLYTEPGFAVHRDRAIADQAARPVSGGSHMGKYMHTAMAQAAKSFVGHLDAAAHITIKAADTGMAVPQQTLDRAQAAYAARVPASHRLFIKAHGLRISSQLSDNPSALADYNASTREMRLHGERGHGAHTLAHESGHALDHALAALRYADPDKLGQGVTHQGTSFRFPGVSSTPEFRAIYNKYKDNAKLWDYMRSNTAEMFAEGYAMYLATTAATAPSPMRTAYTLRDEAPALYAYLEKVHKEVEGHVRQHFPAH